ncbi:hypothetical protein AYL99_11800 [Fonsecaea erecta]|uniref:Uncharacterized protein n=1 Tax=Fonsecaea erecta TaxID=1367422 RepID=A0A178Z2P8_9EURO|nr:hypothetical protein AYL99_11800 [Fonsecaea erecta]OAP54040.1 hypothetical protein AYL99_11800 [Fonsecaea erecta]
MSPTTSIVVFPAARTKYAKEKILADPEASSKDLGISNGGAASVHLRSTLMSKISVKQGSAIRIVTGDYVSAQKIPDLFIRWTKSMGDNRIHTIIEVGQTQSLPELRRLAPFYLNNNADVQRVVLIKMTETPTFKSPVSTEVSQEFRRDETTGVIWCGTAKVIRGTSQSTKAEIRFVQSLSELNPQGPVRDTLYGHSSLCHQYDVDQQPSDVHDFMLVRSLTPMSYDFTSSPLTELMPTTSRTETQSINESLSSTISKNEPGLPILLLSMLTSKPL